MKVNIIELIPIGVANAIKQKELAAITGLSEREVRAAVLSARRKGVPICSGDKGYWIPLDVDEAMIGYRALLSRIMTGFVAICPLKDYIRRESTRENWEALEAFEQELEKNAHGVDTP